MKKTKVLAFDAFAAALDSTPAPSGSKTSKHKKVTPPKSVALAVTKFIEAKNAIAKLEGEQAECDVIIKNFGREEWIKMYKEMKRMPDNFNIAGDNADELMFQMKDAYKKLKTKERFDYLAKKYGAAAVEAAPTFYLNPEIYEKHGEEVRKALSAAIQAMKIPEADKLQLLKAEVDYRVKKGTIANLLTVSNTVSPEEILVDIEPIAALKA